MNSSANSNSSSPQSDMKYFNRAATTAHSNQSYVHGILDHILELQNNIFSSNAMEQYYTSQKTKQLEELKKKYISFFQALLTQSDKMSTIDSFNKLSKTGKTSYLINQPRKFFSDLNSKILWLVHNLKRNSQLLTNLMRYADLQSQEIKNNLASCLVTFYLTDPASDKPNLSELLARMPLFIKELFQKPGFRLENLFTNKSFCVILMKQFLKTRQARHSVRQIFKEVLSKIEFEQLQTVELDVLKTQERVRKQLQKKHRNSIGRKGSNPFANRKTGSPYKKRNMYASRSSSEQFQLSSIFSASTASRIEREQEEYQRASRFSSSNMSNILSQSLSNIKTGAINRNQIIGKSQDQIFQNELFRQQIKSRKSVALGGSKNSLRAFQNDNNNNNNNNQSKQNMSVILQNRQSFKSFDNQQDDGIHSPQSKSKKQKQSIQKRTYIINEANRIVNQSILKLKTAVQMIIAAICSNISAVPFHIRSACKILCAEIEQKFENKFMLDRNSIVFEYLFSKWWIPCLANPVAFGLLGRNYLNQRSSQVFLDIIKVINKIAKGQFFEQEDKLFGMNNVIEVEIQVMNQYLKALIDIQDISTIQKQEENSYKPFQIKVACLSLDDIKAIYSIMIKNIDEFNKINSTCESIISAIEYKQSHGGVFSPDKIEAIYPNDEKLKKSTNKYFLFFDYDEIKQKKQLSNDNQKEESSNDSKAISLPKMPAKIRSQQYGHSASLIQQHAEEIKQVPMFLRSTTTDISAIESDNDRPATGLFLLYNQMYKEKLIKCFEVFLRNANYLREIRFYTQDVNRIGLVDILNFIEERQAIERAEENYQMSLACIFLRKLFGYNKFEQNQINEKLTEMINKLSIQKIQEHQTNKEKLFLSLNQFNSMSMKIAQRKKQTQKNVKHLEEINTQQKVETILSKTDIELCIGREKLNFGNKRFTDRMGSFTEMRQYLEQDDQNYAEIKFRFQEYMEAVADSIKIAFPQSDQTTLSELVDEVQNYIMLKLYKNVFPSKPTATDIEIHQKILSLQWMKPQHFDIIKEKQQPQLWQLSMRELNKIVQARSPKQKLGHLIQSFKIGADCLTIFSRKKGDLAGLDDILPVFTYIILKAKVPMLDTNLKFIDRFRNKEKLLGQAGFCKTHVQTAIGYFMNLNGKSLQMNEQQFQRKILQENRDSTMDLMILGKNNTREKARIQQFEIKENKKILPVNVLTIANQKRNSMERFQLSSDQELVDDDDEDDENNNEGGGDKNRKINLNKIRNQNHFGQRQQVEEFQMYDMQARKFGIH